MRTGLPKFCPRSDCPSHAPLAPAAPGAPGGVRRPFTFQCRGTYSRRCDRRIVRRYFCLTCRRGFSDQTFRVDYRLKRPDLLPRFFEDRVSKMTHRQSARIHGCARITEERHFRRLQAHCRDFHEARLAEILRRGGLGSSFSLDELETYETHRIFRPVTVPVLIERGSLFLLDFRVGTLAPRRQPKTGEELEPRKSESKALVQALFERMIELAPKHGGIDVFTDRKPTYAALLKKLVVSRVGHQRISSLLPRGLSNPLFGINHTFARMRDGISRLVRETWAAAKERAELAGHLAIWACYSNYVRWRFNRKPLKTPAMCLGLESDRWSVVQLLSKRIFPPDFAQR